MVQFRAFLGVWEILSKHTGLLHGEPMSHMQVNIAVPTEVSVTLHMQHRFLCTCIAMYLRAIGIS